MSADRAEHDAHCRLGNWEYLRRQVVTIGSRTYLPSPSLPIELKPQVNGFEIKQPTTKLSSKGGIFFCEYERTEGLEKAVVYKDDHNYEKILYGHMISLLMIFVGKKQLQGGPISDALQYPSTSCSSKQVLNFQEANLLESVMRRTLLPTGAHNGTLWNPAWDQVI